MILRRALFCLLGFLSIVSVAFAQVSPTVPGTASLGQTRVPMILPSSGTMGNNGALTLTTALDQTYTAAYFYIPVNVISASTPAGFYYGVASSTTAITLYNNLYVSGTPKIPASPTPFVTTGVGGYTQTTGSSLTCWTITLPAGALGVNDEVQAHGVLTFIANTNSKTFNVTYGNSNFIAFSETNVSNSFQSFQGGFGNQGTVGIQVGTGATAGTLSASSATPYSGATDGTASKTLSASLKLATATDYLVMQSLTVIRIFGANN